MGHRATKKKAGGGLAHLRSGWPAGTLAVSILALAAVVPLAWAQDTQRTGALGFETAVADDPDAQMVLESNELIYDFDRNVVTAQGDVEIYYQGYTLESDRVIYDQNTRRVFARGNVRIVEPDGTVIYADTVELTDDFAEGFVEQLTVITTEDTRFAAISAERVDDNLTIFTQGVYTACEVCEDQPDRAPVWQIKSARIIHDQQEQVVYHENASFELLGMPIAYVPFLRHPDPTVRRQSGFLAPQPGYDQHLGGSLKVPYFFALAPNYDLTVAATGFTRQGGMGEFEWRHRLKRGSYMIEGAAIRQLDPEAFIDLPGERDFRGFIRAAGQFHINEFWHWGFDGRLSTDTTFQRDYRFTSDTEYRDEVFLIGQSARNWFDARIANYESLVREVDGPRLPFVHPVIDHNYIFDQPVLGGRLSLDSNVISLTRDQAEFANVTPRMSGELNCSTDWNSREIISETLRQRILDDCELIGAPGNYNRVVSQATWEASFTDNLGQVFTPFAWVRGDIYALDIKETFLDQTGGLPMIGEFVETGSHTAAHAMPAVGMEYRWPFLLSASWGQQVIEPIAQVIVRPDAPDLGEIPNEDAQSLIFDDTTLFARDKFSGYDLIEGGTRANVGVRYNLQANNGMSAGAMFGQSYQLAGENPFPLGSGLETSRSDYVASVRFEPVSNLQLATRVRLDEADMSLRRQDIVAQGSYGSLTARATYSEIGADPDFGIDFHRREIQGTASIKLDENWRVFGGGRIELEGPEEGSQWISNRVGIGYSDECIVVSLAYERRYVRTGDLEPDERVVFRFNLRTVAEGEIGATVGSGSGRDFLGN